MYCTKGHKLTLKKCSIGLTGVKDLHYFDGDQCDAFAWDDGNSHKMIFCSPHYSYKEKSPQPYINKRCVSQEKDIKILRNKKESSSPIKIPCNASESLNIHEDSHERVTTDDTKEKHEKSKKIKECIGIEAIPDDLKEFLLNWAKIHDFEELIQVFDEIVTHQLIEIISKIKFK